MGSSSAAPTTSSSSSPPTRSCCTSRRPRFGRRVAPAAASPASGSRPVHAVVYFGAVDAAADNVVVDRVRVVGRAAGHRGGHWSRSRRSREYPGKGRGTGGVRCHRFLKGEDTLLVAAVVAAPRPRRPLPAGRRSTCPRSTAAATAPAHRPRSRSSPSAVRCASERRRSRRRAWQAVRLCAERHA